MELRRRMKSKISIMVMVVLMLSTVFVSANEMQGTVIASQGIVRKTNSFNGDVVKVLPIGTKVSVLEIKEDWYRVKNEDFEGWMYQDILALEDSEEIDTEEKGIITASILNVRSEANSNGKIITKLNQGAEVIIIGRQEEWLQIKIQQTEQAWVHSDFIKLIPNHPPGIVLKNNVALREEQSTTAKSILSLSKDEKVYIKSYFEGWYLVLTDQFVEGWVDEADVELLINLSNPVNRAGDRTNAFHNVVEVTKPYLGKKYRYGQAGPNRFDCSGFSYYILNRYYKEYLNSKGIKLPRSSKDQATVGTNVSRGNLQIGDLVFFNTDAKMGKKITHVGIYIGNGNFIHASSARAVVMVSSLSEGYYNQRYIKAVRL